MLYKKILCLAAFACLWLVAPSAHSAPGDAADTRRRDAEVAFILDLLDHQHYTEGAQAVQQLFLDFPDAIESYELRAALELHVGAIDAAQRDLTFAYTLADGSDAVPAYGLGLCAIFDHDYATASSRLTEAEAIASTDQRDDVRLAEAIADIGQNDYADGIPIAESIDSPTANAVLGLAQMHNEPDKGMETLQALLDTYKVNGLPRVTELSGLRYDGYLGEKSLLEPSMTEPVLQAMFAQRLTFDKAPMAVGAEDVVMGVQTLKPSQNTLDLCGPGDLTVSIAVDGHVLALLSDPPYAYDWDTRSVANGRHVIRYDITNNKGILVQYETKKLNIANAASPLSPPSLALPPDLAARLWKTLRIQPSFKAGEYAIAQAYIKRGDRGDAITHILNCAALDSDFRNVGAVIPQIFHGSPSQSIRLASNETAESYPAISRQAGEFWSGSPRYKEVAMTFDDGPSPVGTPPMLDALKAAGAQATFFVVGIRATQSPDIIRRMVADGHEVENHTYTHPNLDEAIPQHIEEEYLRNGVVIRELTGRWPRFLRPPGGNTNPQVMKIAHDCGMIGGFWTIDALNAEDTGSSDKVAQYVLSEARPGAIILMHNGVDATTGAIPAMVAGLRARGYKIVTLRQLALDAGLNVP